MSHKYREGMIQDIKCPYSFKKNNDNVINSNNPRNFKDFKNILENPSKKLFNDWIDVYFNINLINNYIH